MTSLLGAHRIESPAAARVFLIDSVCDDDVGLEEDI